MYFAAAVMNTMKLPTIAQETSSIVNDDDGPDDELSRALSRLSRQRSAKQTTKRGRSAARSAARSAGRRSRSARTPDSRLSMFSSRMSQMSNRENSSVMYDTDMDCDVNAERLLRKTMSPRDWQDKIVAKYIKACKKNNTFPVRSLKTEICSDSINLTHRNIGPNGAAALAETVVYNGTLERLNLEDNGLGPEGIDRIMDIVAHCENIKYLNIGMNFIGLDGTKYVSEMIATNCSITELVLTDNRLGMKEVQALVEGLKENINIKILDLSRNRIGDEATPALAVWGQQAYNLVELKMGWNDIRGKGAVVLCRALQHSRSITHLDFGWNGFAFEGALGINKLLQINRSVRVLDITHNRIDVYGAEKVARGLEGNPVIETLKIGHNPMNVTGVMHLVDAVSSWRCIAMKFLDMEAIPVTQTLITAFSNLEEVRSIKVRHGIIAGTIEGHHMRIERKMRQEPLKMLMQHLSVNGIRVLDLFRNSTMGGTSRQMTRKQFVKGLVAFHVQLGDITTQNLLARLDPNETGYITYNDLVDAVKKTKIAEWDRNRKELEELRKIRERNKRIMSIHAQASRAGNRHGQSIAADLGFSENSMPNSVVLSDSYASSQRVPAVQPSVAAPTQKPTAKQMRRVSYSLPKIK